MDPITKELSRMISERKYQEIFTWALQRLDVSLVSWVDLPELLLMNPVPLSQGVLVHLLQQLACDIGTDTSRKLSWMTNVLTAIGILDEETAVKARPYLESVKQSLNHQLNAGGRDVSAIILILHVITSMLMSFYFHLKFFQMQLF